jgi:hypothetical protein
MEQIKDRFKRWTGGSNQLTTIELVQQKKAYDSFYDLLKANSRTLTFNGTTENSIVDDIVVENPSIPWQKESDYIDFESVRQSYKEFLENGDVGSLSLWQKTNNINCTLTPHQRNKLIVKKVAPKYLKESVNSILEWIEKAGIHYSAITASNIEEIVLKNHGGHHLKESDIKEIKLIIELVEKIGSILVKECHS